MNSSTMPSTDWDSFFKGLKNQLVLQSKEKNKDGKHPDPVVRNFNLAVLNLLYNDSNLIEILRDVYSKRNSIDFEHTLLLLPRVTQYMLRKAKIDAYSSYSLEEWSTILDKLCREPEFLQLLLTKNNSNTKPKLRYRALAALLKTSKNSHINLIDWGCSLNLGLAGIMNPNYLVFDQSFEDHTPDYAIKNLLKSSNNTYIEKAIGVDISSPNDPEQLQWVKACEYLGQYDETAIEIDQDLIFLANERKRLNNITGSINSSEVISQIKDILNETPYPTIIHASMVLYQLDAAQRIKAMETASLLLKEGEMLLELTPSNRFDWFSHHNIASVVRFKEGNNLSEPLIWLEWSSSRCEQVWTGKDFKEVHKRLSM